jgi:hypothetical protein
VAQRCCGLAKPHRKAVRPKKRAPASGIGCQAATLGARVPAIPDILSLRDSRADSTSDSLPLTRDSEPVRVHEVVIVLIASLGNPAQGSQQSVDGPTSDGYLKAHGESK